MTLHRRLALVAATTIALLAPGAARAAGVEGLQPFPSDLLTVSDPAQPTGLRVDLPKPNCAVYVSDCQDVDVLNGLDGFNVQPRITVPFSGPIDLASVSSASIQLYDLSCLVCAPVGINQTVWEPAQNALHFESDRLLREGTQYLLVVTTAVHAADGTPLDRTSFLHDLNFGQTKDPHTKAYRKALKQALDQVGEFTTAAAASLFTTQTATDELAAIRGQLDAGSPAPATIEASIPVGGITAIDFVRQVGTSPSFSTSAVPIPALQVFPGSVARIVFGSYVSPQYENAARVIPAVPAVQSHETIEFELFVPAGPVPAGGFPVALFGHGFGDNKNNSPFVVASTMAHSGIATIAINVVGHGGGSLGSLVVHTVSGNVTVLAGGRGIDQDGNHVIDSTEGVNAAPPYTLVGNRDGLRQTAIDLMQLVRLIRAGGIPDLSTSRIYYFGQSFGGIYGGDLLGTDPDIRAGVLNVPGGSIIEVARLGGFRPLVGIALFGRTPSLYNVSPPNAPLFTNFVENIPLRGQPILVDTFPGASAIQESFDRNEWAQQAGNPVAYASRITPAKVIVQFAKGDQTVPNPTASALIRAGGLESRATYFRNDLAFAISSTFTKNPHTFLTRLTSPLPAVAALQAQGQIATFFATDGASTIDPDGAGQLFETPIAGPLPEDLNFIP